MNNKPSYIIILLLTIIEIFFLVNTKIVTNSVIDSLKIFILNIFPSLFPTMIVGNLLIKNNVILIIPNFIKKFLKKIFNFSDVNTSIFIMSFICGSPSNAMFINEYLDKNIISEKEAESMLCITHFINPLFIISTSLLLFKSMYEGVFIIFIMLVVNLIKAYLLRKNFNNKNNSLLLFNNSFISNLFITIKDAFSALLLILGIIILFNILLALISHILMLNSIIQIIINCLLEITTGLIKISTMNINCYLKLFIMYYALSFGGLCIQIQTLSMIKNKNIRYLKYLMFRII